MNRMNWLKNKLAAIISLAFILMVVIGCGSGSGNNTTALIPVSGGSGGGTTTQTGKAVTLTWAVPLSNTEDLAGYRVYYGTAPGNYTSSVDVSANTTSQVISNLNPGTTYYFAVAAFNSAGDQSPYSNVASKAL